MSPVQVELARRLRRDQTDAEAKLWAQLRDRGLDGHKFRRQHPVGRYIADFLCEEAMLIVEVDGGQHSPEVDGPRDAYLAKHGFRVLRFWNNDVLDNIEGVLMTISTEIAEGSE